MARTDTLTVPANSWLQLTNSDATAVTFQVKSGAVQLVATIGAVPPTDSDNAFEYVAGQGESNFALSNLALDTPTVNRLYARAISPSASVTISHG